MENGTLEDLLYKYSQGDPEAFSTFYHKTRPVLRRFLQTKLSTSYEVEDVLQDTFLRIHRYIVSYDASRPALPWLFLITKNALVDYVNARKRITLADETGIVNTPSSAPGPDLIAEFRDVLAKLSANLSAEEGALLVERVFYETPHQVIAEKNGWSSDNVRQKFSRLIKNLDLLRSKI